MTRTQSYVTDLISSQGGIIANDSRQDLEHAIGEMNTYPIEERTLTRLIPLVKNHETKSALSAVQDIAKYRFWGPTS